MPAYSYLLISTKPKVKKYIITLYIDIKNYLGSAFIQLKVIQKAVCISPEGKFCMMTSQARFTAMIIMKAKYTWSPFGIAPDFSPPPLSTVTFTLMSLKRLKPGIKVST